MNPIIPAPRAWSPWPVAIIGFFALAIAAAIGFVIFCNIHSSDLVANDYYEQEVRYQGQLDRENRTQALGALASIRYEATKQIITVAIPHQHPQAPVSGMVHLYRPSAAGMDRNIKLHVDAAGTQLIDASALPAGLWEVKVSWNTDGREFFMNQKIRI